LNIIFNGEVADEDCSDGDVNWIPYSEEDINNEGQLCECDESQGFVYDELFDDGRCYDCTKIDADCGLC